MRVLGMWEQWECESNGNVRAMGMWEYWEFESIGNLRVLGMWEHWECESNKCMSYMTLRVMGITYIYFIVRENITTNPFI